ncbi:hypothetical protein BSU04_29145 [Caballeronia sordidicola]|uniref:Uncharacterized protein n=1 Tax=Caballeronia sordidicola TaxID=196367 RepID=A0A226WW31_CABSO|nr:hypothetical protein BSU04_29145 [Caballeronia sordidicola]
MTASRTIAGMAAGVGRGASVVFAALGAPVDVRPKTSVV